MEESKHLELRPGQPVTVTVECARCESYRWRAVNPYRNIGRALKRLTALSKPGPGMSQENYDLVGEAVYFLEHGEADARILAQHAKHDDPPRQRQDGLDDQLRDVIELANSIGCYDAADFIAKGLPSGENLLAAIDKALELPEHDAYAAIVHLAQKGKES